MPPAFFQALEAAGNRLDLGEKVICEGGDRAKSESELSDPLSPPEGGGRHGMEEPIS